LNILSTHYWPTIRLADPVSAARYPLPVHGPADFVHVAEGEWTITLPIPTIPSDAILVASFVTPGSITPDHQFRLTAAADEWPLLPVPSLVGERPDQVPMNDAVTTHIDCWHTRSPVNGPTIRLRITTDLPPDLYFIAISSRPITITAESLPGTCVMARIPPAISQMTAEEPLRRSICSPTSLAMLVPGTGRDEVLAWTRDRATGMHGSWALAARAAALKGAVAAVELQSDWETALAVLRAGLPFAASIRFAAGELQGAPLNGTSGHLVVVYGLEGNAVLVHDPAADCDDTVPRRYDLAEFTNAWLASRGASYIIAP
jgi:Peptidase_C39 like family